MDLCRAYLCWNAIVDGVMYIALQLKEGLDMDSEVFIVCSVCIGMSNIFISSR